MRCFSTLSYGFVIFLCRGSRHAVEVPPLCAQGSVAGVAHDLAQQLAVAQSLSADPVACNELLLGVDVGGAAHIVDLRAHVESVALGVAERYVDRQSVVVHASAVGRVAHIDVL